MQPDQRRMGSPAHQRLSVTKTVTHFLKKLFSAKASERNVGQKDTETSLIEQFMYPKLGPGQLWELVAEKVREIGGQIVTGFDVSGIHVDGAQVVSLLGHDTEGKKREFFGDYFFSTMPVQELIRALDAPVPSNVREISEGLQYRDFITVGLLALKLSVREKSRRRSLRTTGFISRSPTCSAGRLQIFNNWSPFLVRDPETVWIGVEYFCYETDAMWKLADAEMIALAKRELEQIGILKQADVLDGTVIRMPKTYPAYFGTYERFDELREYVDSFENLFLVGRNGMHKYNNQDHSMLTAMTAVDNILAGRMDKGNLWAVNTEMEYHEEREMEVEVAVD